MNMSSTHMALLGQVAAGVVKAMRCQDGAVQVWVDGVFVDDPGPLEALCDAGLVAEVPTVAPKAKPVQLTEAGRMWLARHTEENAA